MLVKPKPSFSEMSQCLPAAWPICKQLCCWCQPEPPGASPRLCLLEHVLWEQNVVSCINTQLWMLECISGAFVCLCVCVCVFVVLTTMPGGLARGALCCVFASVCVCVCVCFSSDSLCVSSPGRPPSLSRCVCACDISFGWLTAWRICAVIVVWLSSFCNWKCLISETFFQDVYAGMPININAAVPVSRPITCVQSTCRHLMCSHVTMWVCGQWQLCITGNIKICQHNVWFEHVEMSLDNLRNGLILQLLGN